jgi:sugar phosphate isomerase/epimerase
MNLSMTTDYAISEGCPEPSLRSLAEAGFTHVHWCHQWNTDFLYDAAEIDAVAAWMREFGLGLTDLHGSQGMEKRWTSPREYERLAGVALVKNRMAMARRLGSDVVIMHTGGQPAGDADAKFFWESLLKSLDELQPAACEYGVRLAIENCGHAPVTERLLDAYSPDYLGLCYDSGHGNLHPKDLDQCEAHRDRLISLHLHDNDGTRDHHWIPFTGTVDWERVARLVATSSYSKWPNLEATMKHASPISEADFLAQARSDAGRFAALVRSFQPTGEAR